MSSCQFFHDCSFVPVNGQKKKEKERNNPSPIINYIIFQFSAFFRTSYFHFPAPRARFPFPVPRSPFLLLVTSPCKQDRMSCGKSDSRGCFIQLELWIIKKKKNKTTKKESYSRLMHH